MIIDFLSTCFIEKGVKNYTYNIIHVSPTFLVICMTQSHSSSKLLLHTYSRVAAKKINVNAYVRCIAS